MTATGGKLRRITALVRKELLQIWRDPSSFIIAGVLPLLLLFIFGYGVSLDLDNIPLGVVIENPTLEAESLLTSFQQSRYFQVRVARHRNELEQELVAGRLRGVVVVAEDFSDRLGRGETAPVQVLVDGSDPNTAGLVQFYVQGVWSNWLEQEALSKASLVSPRRGGTEILVQPRYWYNPAVDSHDFLLPGAVAIILTLIGTLLTALVIAREWERGTMEALMATPVARLEFLLGKVIPYFLLGMAGMGLAVAATVFLFGVPFRGSILALVIVSAVFLSAMLAWGLLISILTRNQFAASQAALLSAFLPGFQLSGFIFEINSMPWPIQLLTYVLPPRYFVSCLRTLFLVGDVPAVLVPNTLILAGFAILFFFLLGLTLRMRL
jgi:ABC-2 type transport system permease protein